MGTWADKRRREEELFFVQQHEAPPSLPRGHVWFLVDAKWMERWWSYVTTPDCPAPGPIANEVLVEDGWQLRLNGDAPGHADKPLLALHLGTDYVCVTALVWCFLAELHGSSALPPLARYTKDIYGELVPMTSLEKIMKGPRLQAKVLATSFNQYASENTSPHARTCDKKAPTTGADRIWQVLALVPLELWTQLQFCTLLLTDMVIRARFGASQWQGSAWTTIWISVPTLFVQFILLTVGVLGANATAAGAPQVVGVWLQAALVFALVAAVPATLWYAYLADSLSWIAKDQATLATAQEFASTLAIGLWPQFAFTAIASVVASRGSTAPVIVAHVATWLLNALLNLVLVDGWYGVPALGVAGSAWATVTSQFVQWIVFTTWVVFVSSPSFNENWGGWTRECLCRLQTFIVTALSTSAVWTSTVPWLALVMVMSFAETTTSVASAAVQAIFLCLLQCGRLCAQGIVNVAFNATTKVRIAATVILVFGMGAHCAGVRFGGIPVYRYFWGPDVSSMMAFQSLQPAYCWAVGILTCSSTMQVWLLDRSDDAFFQRVGQIGATAVVYVPLAYVMSVQWQWGLGGLWWAVVCSELWVILALCWATVRGKICTHECEETRSLLPSTASTKPPSRDSPQFVSV
ncbi:hypothetical protein H310_01017 [Aphanomyces invadans]|uniref:DUSP domain-containing protein n=1 Tax=Aphanomyces invadans TaxID=157072 RepID=A0A024UQK3_9STRA|nr:hypothetical protein H310_01017 [Aphanomyces invadans]ETW08435.1 hypothetical protein H310_01017 [Aphanomyces invadans]|eukprot:XP_008862240.1 hypothetical protein H310_01017 [Aphanomyces invadans]